MKALGDYLHGKKLRFGIYSDAGTQTCGGFPGSEGHEVLDADTIAGFGADYLKYDGCYSNKSEFFTSYSTMGGALRQSGRNISFSC